MTTIAFDGRMMAADTQQTCDFIDNIECRKIRRLGPQLVGFCGNLSLSLAIIEWFRLGADPKTVPRGAGDNPAVLIIADEFGVSEIHNDTGFPINPGIPYAIGSGSPYAMAAMLAGADARKAVQIAIKLDPYSGGKIRSLKLKGSRNVRNNQLSPIASTGRARRGKGRGSAR